VQRHATVRIRAVYLRLCFILQKRADEFLIA
jgi:hypothetical protein